VSWFPYSFPFLSLNPSGMFAGDPSLGLYLLRMLV
jgi:hypothetical protein